MKLLHRSQAVIGLALILFTRPVNANPPLHVRVVLSPHGDPIYRDRAGVVLRQLIEKSPLGSEIILVDGWAKTTICKIQLPASIHFDSIQNKVGTNKPALRRFENWLKGKFQTGSPSALVGAASIDWPGSFDFVCRDQANENELILILASPLHDSLSEPQFSFRPDRFAADGHLFAPQEATPFSVVNHRDRLKKRRVWVLYPTESIFATDIHKDRVARFWSLYCNYQSGVLCGFSGDLAQTVRSIINGGTEPPDRDVLDLRFNKVEMLSVRRPIPPLRHLTNDFPAATFVANSTPEPSNPPRLPAERDFLEDLSRTAAEDTAVGVMWTTPGTDLDLYCWPTPSSSVPLFFQNTIAPEGRYVHDYRNANEGVDYEKVLLRGIERLDQLRIAVNFFEGVSATPVSGKVFIRHKGQTFAGTFNLEARQGNGGADREKRNSSPYWTSILPTKLQLIGSQSAAPTSSTSRP